MEILIGSCGLNDERRVNGCQWVTDPQFRSYGRQLRSYGPDTDAAIGVHGRYWLVEPTSPLHELPLLGPEDGIPVLLHVYNEPAALGGLLEGFDELAGALCLGVIGIFASAVAQFECRTSSRADNLFRRKRAPPRRA